MLFYSVSQVNAYVDRVLEHLAAGRMTEKARRIHEQFVDAWSGMLGNRLTFECDEEETNYITRPGDAAVIYPAIVRALRTRRAECFIDAFACVGGDTLAAMYYLRRLPVHAVQLNDTPASEGRFARLAANVERFNRMIRGRPARGYAHGTDIRSFLCENTEILAGSILYLDPPWTVDSATTGISPLREIAAFLDAHVWRALRVCPGLIVLKLPAEAADVQDWPYLARHYSLAERVSPRGRFHVHIFQRRELD
jgi:hypothetical protein